MNRGELEKESSMLNWYPKVSSLLPTPKTVMMELTGEEHDQVYGMLDGEAMSKGLEERILCHAREIGFPLFMRSDQGSGKHYWEDTCYVEKEADLFGHLCRLVEWHAMAGFFGLDFDALVFREFIPLQSGFMAFAGMPVAIERRYFVRDGQVVCHHPYWPEDAIHGNNLPDDWKARLARMSVEPREEVYLLMDLAARFGQVNPGYWSVDFAKAKDTTRGAQGWYLIDAARGEISWHPDNCPHKPKEGT